VEQWVEDVAANVERCLTAVEQLRFAALRAHDSGVGLLTGALCRVMGLESGFATKLQYAAGLHDIGKVTLPDVILKKPGNFDAAEWVIMRRHTTLGFDILQGSNDATIKLAAIVALRHHERWDGTGYPDGLAEEAIPRAARIVGICDVYHALREMRPYKPPLSHERAMSIILEGDESGRTQPTHFDPTVLAAFKSCFELIREVYEESLPFHETCQAA
jgi:putative two-component system response regulator